jgi:phenylacetate-CoA ligase
VLGRMGAGVKIRGMFVYDHDVRSAAESMGLDRYQLVVGRNAGRDLLELQIPSSSVAGRDPAALVDAFRAAIKLTVTVVTVEDLDDSAAALVDARDIWDV